MLVLVFIILMLIVVGKLISLAIKAAWGIAKVLLTIVFFPVVLIILAFAGAMSLAIVLLVIGGIIAFVSSALK